jgi:hypothetical protein
MRAIRRAWRRLELGWRTGLRRLPCFTQRTAVLLVGVLVAALAMLGGVVALVGWPGADGPTHLVPGERAGQRPESRPGAGTAAPRGPGDGRPVRGRRRRRGGGLPVPGRNRPVRPCRRGSRRPDGPRDAASRRHGRRGTRVRRCGRRGRPGPAGRTADHPAVGDHHDHRPPGPLDPVDDLLGPVVSTLLP